MRRTTALIVASAVGLAGGIALAPAALAKDGDTKARGNCSASSSFAAKVKSRDGGVRVEFQVKTDTVNEPWKLTITQGGVSVLESTRTTRASDDDSNDDSYHAAEVKWWTFRPSGAGALVFSAVGGGETCAVTIPR
jgi:hypothetical protein